MSFRPDNNNMPHPKLTMTLFSHFVLCLLLQSFFLPVPSTYLHLNHILGELPAPLHLFLFAAFYLKRYVNYLVYFQKTDPSFQKKAFHYFVDYTHLYPEHYK